MATKKEETGQLLFSAGLVYANERDGFILYLSDPSLGVCPAMKYHGAAIGKVRAKLASRHVSELQTTWDKWCTVSVGARHYKILFVAGCYLMRTKRFETDSFADLPSYIIGQGIPEMNAAIIRYNISLKPGFASHVMESHLGSVSIGAKFVSDAHLDAYYSTPPAGKYIKIADHYGQGGRQYRCYLIDYALLIATSPNNDGAFDPPKYVMAVSPDAAITAYNKYNHGVGFGRRISDIPE